MATLTCIRCGATYDTHVQDTIGIPRLPYCPAIYQSPGPFPQDQSNPGVRISGACNGKLQ